MSVHDCLLNMGSIALGAFIGYIAAWNFGRRK